MVYCGSVRIKIGVYTSGIFCFELPKWIKWNKKLLFYKIDQRINSLPDYLSWSSSELLKADSDQLESVQIQNRFWSVEFHCNIGFPLRWKEGGNTSEPIHTVSFPTLHYDSWVIESYIYDFGIEIQWIQVNINRCRKWCSKCDNVPNKIPVYLAPFRR